MRGLLGIVLVISILEQKFGACVILKTCCDSLSALQRVVNSADYLNMNWSQFDLLTHIQNIWKTLNSPVAFAHIPTYQDASGRSATLSPDVKLNVRMDSLAKDYATTQALLRSLHPQSNPFALTVDTQLVSSNFTRSCYGKSFQPYLEEKGHTNLISIQNRWWLQ